MEIVDNAIMPAIPGAMNAGLNIQLFRDSLILALGIAFFANFPVNYRPDGSGRGPTVVHEHHGH